MEGVAMLRSYVGLIIEIVFYFYGGLSKKAVFFVRGNLITYDLN